MLLIWLGVLAAALAFADEQLYPLIHGYMTLLRFPVNSVEAKVACAASLACLSERWTGDWKSFTVLSKVRAVHGKVGSRNPSMHSWPAMTCQQ